MGLVGRLAWVNSYSKKQCRSLFWRVRAAVRKAAKNGSKQQQFKFQYDPWSYALNFDDGHCYLGGEASAKHNSKLQTSISGTTTLVYVLWVKPK